MNICSVYLSMIVHRTIYGRFLLSHISEIPKSTNLFRWGCQILTVYIYNIRYQLSRSSEIPESFLYKIIIQNTKYVCKRQVKANMILLLIIIIQDLHHLYLVSRYKYIIPFIGNKYKKCNEIVLWYEQRYIYCVCNMILIYY